MFERWYREDGAWVELREEGIGSEEDPGSWKDGFEGRCMRWEVEGLAENADESPSTEIPVVFGESGEAIMGAGRVRRFKYIGVLCSSERGKALRGGLVDRCSDDVDDIDMASRRLPPYIGVLLPKSPLVGVLIEDKSSSPAASLVRSSHLPRVASRLFVTRCDGVHLLVLGGFPEPVGLVRIPKPDCELLLERELPPPLEDVRSKRRVWYAKGPEATGPDLELEETFDEVEFERSIG